MVFLALAALLFTAHPVHRFAGERVNGFAVDGASVVAWGGRIVRIALPGGDAREIRGRDAGPVEAACLLKGGMVAAEPGALAFYRLPDGARRLIDTGVETQDVVPATLFGRRGVLLIHKRQQVRFYGAPDAPRNAWPPPRDVYSIYTPSHQGGLLPADIDGDGRTDILCGNYWIRSPESFDLPWRLFAINVWTEEERSAMLRLAWDGRVLVAAQRELSPARLAWFERPADVRQQWLQHRLGEGLALAQPNTVELADFDLDGRPDILVAERAGAGRVIVFRNLGAGRYEPQTIARGSGVIRGAVADVNRDGRPDIIVLRDGALSWLENVRP